jgi:transposase-like protein
MPRCPHCTDAHGKKDGRTASGQRYRCHACARTFTDRTATPFAGFRWPREIITLAVIGIVRSDYRLPTSVICWLSVAVLCQPAPS